MFGENVNQGNCSELHQHHELEHSSDEWDDETVEWYVKNWGDHPTNRMTVELARLEPDDIVVDIGCGSGEAVREAAARATRGRAIGVDPTPAMIRIANELSESHDSQRIGFIESPAERLPIPNNSATVALAINSLHHWDEPTVGLAEAMRILKPGGRLLVTEEEPEDGKFGHGEGPLAEPASVINLIADAGFTDVVLSKHAEGDVRMLAIVARKSAG